MIYIIAGDEMSGKSESPISVEDICRAAEKDEKMVLTIRW